MKLRAVLLHRDLVAQVLTEGHQFRDKLFCDSGLPAGSVLVGASIERDGNLRLLFSHDSFRQVTGRAEELAVSYRTA